MSLLQRAHGGQRGADQHLPAWLVTAGQLLLVLLALIVLLAVTSL